tara:strand:- start:272 stop:961 length:690 start_codon:yes stop_codon:yes gene_type:complete
MSYYAVARGHNIGIYNFWNDCKEQVIGYKGALYKKFENEKDAEDYILNIGSSTNDIFENIYNKFNIDEVDYFVYTDGSCLNNGKINNISGIGIYFDENSKKNVSKILESKFNQTNNSAELYAIIEAYKIIKNDLENNMKICIYSDSEYSIKCATSYGEKCLLTKWSKTIPNRELVIELYNIYKNNPNLMLKHIKAHTNNKDIHSIGNANADKLAYNAIKNYKRDLNKNS